MCGRTTHKFTWAQIHEHLSAFGAALTEEARRLSGPTASYNVPPKSAAPILRAGQGGLEALMAQWWLVPHWSKTSDTKYTTFNAKSEEAASKPAFRSPFKRRRCVLPVSGFYEWRTHKDGTKQPFYITRADGDVLYLAGLWDRWEEKNGDGVLESCTILTRTPNAEMKTVHDRMPCVLEPGQITGWCDPELTDVDRITAYLGPVADGLLTMHAVDRRVGNARTNNDPQLIEPV